MTSKTNAMELEDVLSVVMGFAVRSTEAIADALDRCRTHSLAMRKGHPLTGYRQWLAMRWRGHSFREALPLHWEEFERLDEDDDDDDDSDDGGGGGGGGGDDDNNDLYALQRHWWNSRHLSSDDWDRSRQQATEEVFWDAHRARRRAGGYHFTDELPSKHQRQAERAYIEVVRCVQRSQSTLLAARLVSKQWCAALEATLIGALATTVPLAALIDSRALPCVIAARLEYHPREAALARPMTARRDYSYSWKLPVQALLEVQAPWAAVLAVLAADSGAARMAARLQLKGGEQLMTKVRRVAPPSVVAALGRDRFGKFGTRARRHSAACHLQSVALGFLARQKARRLARANPLPLRERLRRGWLYTDAYRSDQQLRDRESWDHFSRMFLQPTMDYNMDRSSCRSADLVYHERWLKRAYCNAKRQGGKDWYGQLLEQMRQLLEQICEEEDEVEFGPDWNFDDEEWVQTRLERRLDERHARRRPHKGRRSSVK